MNALVLHSEFSSLKERAVWGGGLFRFGIFLKLIAIAHNRTRDNPLLNIPHKVFINFHDVPECKKKNVWWSRRCSYPSTLLGFQPTFFLINSWWLSVWRIEQRTSGNNFKSLLKWCCLVKIRSPLPIVRIKVRKAMD